MAAGELDALMRDLARPEAWPHAPDSIEVIQTHASVVFLAGDRALKIKKPVDLGFLDFSTRPARAAACEAEVILNRRLAPRTYRGVVAVRRAPRGGLTVVFEEPRDEDEPAVLMVRLPADRTLASLLKVGGVTDDLARRIGRRLAAFHDSAEGGPDVRRACAFDRVARVVRENLAEAATLASAVLDAGLHHRISGALERELGAREALLSGRAARGIGREGHGDLRLDHVYVLDEPPPDDIVVVDCVEFSAAFRRSDPVGDIAALVMEFGFEGRADIGDALFEAWADARGDAEGAALLPLFVAHRHVVRGKVRGIEAREAEVPEAARVRAAARGRAHFLGALSALAGPHERPALVLACGLPGSGKSTVARALAREANIERVSSDETRKALAAAPDGAGGLPADLYSREWTDRTYGECLARSRALLLSGQRVIVDASFHDGARRAPFRELARELRVPCLVIELVVSDAEAIRRLAARVNDASDADADVRRAMTAAWQAPAGDELADWTRLDASRSPRETTDRAIAALRARRLAR